MGRRRIPKAVGGRRGSVLKANPCRVEWRQDNLNECGPQSRGGKLHAVSEPMKRRLTVAAIVVVCIALLALFVLIKGRECRIRWDVGIFNSPFADYNGSDAGAPDTDVGVAYLSTHDRNRLFTRLVWTVVNNSPWYYSDRTTDGKPPVYLAGIPWYEDLCSSDVLYPVPSLAPPATDERGPFQHAWFTAHGFRYDLVFQKQRNLLWIVSDKL